MPLFLGGTIRKEYGRVLGAVLSLLALLVVATACGAPAGPSPGPSPIPNVALTPYLSATALPSALATPETSPTPLPSPTPTPRTHVVQRGDTLLGLALRYGVPLDALMTANPQVDPNLLSVGTPLAIPAAPAGTPTGQALPTPTALPLAVDAPYCAPDATGGVWCSALVHNTTAQDVELVSGAFRLASPSGENIRTEAAFTPLAHIAPQGSLPLFTYFDPPAPIPFEASVELTTALPVAAPESRYLAVSLTPPRVTLSADGLSAEASTTLTLPANSPATVQVKAVLLGLDAQGQVVGLRTWEPPQGQSGPSFDLQITVYSTGQPITRTELLAEARVAP